MSGIMRVATTVPQVRMAISGTKKGDPLGSPFRTAQQSGFCLVGTIGLEPTTPTMSRWCSNQLSYVPAVARNSTDLSPCVNGNLRSSGVSRVRPLHPSDP